MVTFDMQKFWIIACLCSSTNWFESYLSRKSRRQAMIGCIKRNDWLLADTALYFEFENELKFYNLEARFPRDAALQ